jgi:UDP-N-acetylmuramoyl-tripeptide--D-alanyl-D-alanine ligase
MKSIIIWLLKIISVLVLKKYRPLVIAITGSVGKTSAKEAIFAVISKKQQTRCNTKNYNNELGVPLTIIGAESPGKNVFGWLAVLFHSFFLLTHRNRSYPEVLVLEMGADHPGDIAYLTSFIPVEIGVLTAIAPVHLEFFKKIENIIREKQIVIEAVKKSGFAILNGDDWQVRQIQQKSKGQVITFGLNADNDVRAVEVKLSTGKSSEAQTVRGLSFKLFYAGSSIPVFLPGVLGKHQVYAALAGAAVGLALDHNLVEIADALQRFNSPRGRMNLILGIKNSLLIDDTYNSSPTAASAALEVLSEIAIETLGRRIAVFGDMLELGSYTQQGHREVGHRVAELTIDFLLCVGEKSRDIGRGAKEAGMGEERIYYFSNNEKTADFLQQLIKENDLILLKGSQGARLEQVVKAVMAHPENAKHLLVRQEEPWL